MKKILDRHAHMILDPMRTLPLKKAIERTVKKGDVVVDIGTGIGLLAFFACGAGARHILAVDCDRESLDVAKHLAKKFGFERKIEFIEGLSFLQNIKPKADVLICETVGSMAFDENILATILDGKKRFLKRGGKIIPGIVELWGALLDERGTHGLSSDVGGLDHGLRPVHHDVVVARIDILAQRGRVEKILQRHAPLGRLDGGGQAQPQVADAAGERNRRIIRAHSGR